MKRLPEVTEENARQISEAYLHANGSLLPNMPSTTLDAMVRVLQAIHTVAPDEEVMVVPEATQENAELLARERWAMDRKSTLKYVITREWEELEPDQHKSRTESALQYLQALRSMLEPRPCGAAFGHPYPGAVCKLKAGHKEREHECGKLRWKNLVVSRPKSTEELCTCNFALGRVCKKCTTATKLQS